MSKIKAKTLRRENANGVFQILNIHYFAVELRCYASDFDTKSYEKVLGSYAPELNENKANESDSNLMTFLMAFCTKM